MAAGNEKRIYREAEDKQDKEKRFRNESFFFFLSTPSPSSLFKFFS
jgi:hypothetical protein